MSLPYDKSAAVAIYPASAVSQILDSRLREWIARGALSRFETPLELLQCVLDQLGRPYPDTGLAALRMWGQTSDRPTVWIAAADPVYLEPRLDHLCLHALQSSALPGGEFGILLDYLQERLAGRERYGFARIGASGYVRANKPMQTADSPAYVIDQELPNDYMPKGDQTGTYHALRGEVEMALHDHEVNLRRQAEGLPPVNSLWLWGGGFAPEQETVPHPPLFANDPMLKGYWYSKTGVVADWPGTIADCLEASVAGFVAQPTPADTAWVERSLQDLRGALNNGRLSAVTLIFGGLYQLQLRKSDNWKIWRRHSELFGEPE
ncbi:MAG: hypothetical protein ACR2QS_03980 [Woeseiaceae bacterium]